MKSSVLENLENFGLSEKEAETYLLLTKGDWTTALDLSRKTKINRSTLYRILESLEEKGLVQTQIDDKTTYYNTTSIEQLKLVIQEQKQKTEKIENSFHFLKNSLGILQRKSDANTSVRVLKGIKGLQHLEYIKTEKSDQDLYVFDSLQWYKVMGNEFAEEIRSLVVENNITVYELSSDKTPIAKEANVPWTKNVEYIKNNYLHRYIDPNTLKMTDDIFIVDNIIHFYEFEDNDVVGIEIVNKDLANMLKGMFRIFWNQAKVIDNFGGKNL